MRKSVEIVIGKTVLECEGEYTPYSPPVDWDSPPTQESFETDTITLLDGTDVTDLVFELVSDPGVIEEKILDNID